MEERDILKIETEEREPTREGREGRGRKRKRRKKMERENPQEKEKTGKEAVFSQQSE